MIVSAREPVTGRRMQPSLHSKKGDINIYFPMPSLVFWPIRNRQSRPNAGLDSDAG